MLEIMEKGLSVPKWGEKNLITPKFIPSIYPIGPKV